MPRAPASSKMIKEEISLVPAISANLLNLSDKFDTLKEDITEVKADVKIIVERNGSQDKKVAVLEDRVGMMMKILGVGGLLLAGLLVDAVSTKLI